MLAAAHSRRIDEDLLAHDHVDGRMGLGGRQHDRVGGRSERAIGSIKLKSRSTAPDQPEIADDLIIDVLENERSARITALLGAAEIRADVEALCGESGTRHHLWWQSRSSPQPA